MATHRVLRGLEEVKPLLDILKVTGGVIAGGYARYMASPTDGLPEDIDILSIDNDTYSAITACLTKAGYFCNVESKFARTFDAPFDNNLYTNLPIQVLKPIDTLAGPAAEVIKKHDFTVTMAYLKHDINSGICTVETDYQWLAHEANKELHIREVTNPILTIQRMMKYAKKGYVVPVSTIRKVLDSYADLNSNQRVDLSNEVYNL